MSKVKGHVTCQRAPGPSLELRQLVSPETHQPTSTELGGAHSSAKNLDNSTVDSQQQG